MIVTGPRSLYESRLAERNISYADARPCIIAETDTTVTVDTDHPAYPRAKANPSSVWASAGPKLWAELHTCPNPSPQWMEAFTSRIPCGDCRMHWRALLKQVPPQYGNWLIWSVEAHNIVNKRLGKPQWTLAQAMERWPHVKPMHKNDRVALARRICEACSHCKGIQQNRLDRGYVRCDLTKAANGLILLNQFEVRCPMKKPLVEPVKATVKDSLTVGGKEKILLRHHLSPGDVVVMTAAVRDLARAHGDRFIIGVDTTCREIWDNNPYIVPMKAGEPGVRLVECHYPSVHRSNQSGQHFIRGFMGDIAKAIGVDIPLTALKGDIHLSDDEKRWKSQVAEAGHDGPYWVLMAPGGKQDFTAKWSSAETIQKVVDHFEGKIQFVRAGQSHHFHPKIDGTIDLIGKTNLRQFIRLIYHAEGVLCPVTLAMHLAAAVPTKDGKPRKCVVLSGGREPATWERYPYHQFLDTIGDLDCCKTGGCWKSRCQPVGDGDAKDKPANLCPYPVKVPVAVTLGGKALDHYTIPKCMDFSADEIVNAILEKINA